MFEDVTIDLLRTANCGLPTKKFRVPHSGFRVLKFSVQERRHRPTADCQLKSSGFRVFRDSKLTSLPNADCQLRTAGSKVPGSGFGDYGFNVLGPPYATFNYIVPRTSYFVIQKNPAGTYPLRGLTTNQPKNYFTVPSWPGFFLWHPGRSEPPCLGLWCLPSVLPLSCQRSCVQHSPRILPSCRLSCDPPALRTLRSSRL